MTENPMPPLPAPHGPASITPPRRRRRWVWPAATVVALLAGVGIGSSDQGVPQAKYDQVVSDRDDLAAKVETAEAAVTQTEQAAAATQIQIGTWTVGVDIEPGTYRMADPVTSACYWGIYRSGSNGDDIIRTTGFTVTAQQVQQLAAQSRKLSAEQVRRRLEKRRIEARYRRQFRPDSAGSSLRTVAGGLPGLGQR